MVKTKEILKAKSLVDLDRLVISCKRCPLYKEKISNVFGEGNPKATFLFVGEAPGREEDKSGRPFVGRAGKFLDSLFSSKGLKREDTFITNIVKHRPSKNRKPNPQEIGACMPYLLRQIEIINPKLIILLGSVALKEFFPQERIRKTHGKLLKKGKRSYLSLYHPAAAIYNQNLKNTLIRDFRKVKTYIKK